MSEMAESKLFDLPRGSCFDVQGECPSCHAWLASPLVIENAAWTDGSKYRFVAWHHWVHELQRLETQLFWRCRIAHGSPEGDFVTKAFQDLGSTHGTICPGSFATLSNIRPAHSGGSEFLWGPKRKKELKRILTVLVTEKGETR